MSEEQLGQLVDFDRIRKQQRRQALQNIPFLILVAPVVVPLFVVRAVTTRLQDYLRKWLERDERKMRSHCAEIRKY